MKNRATDPFDIRHAWTDASAARFLREVVLRKPRLFTCDGGVVVCSDGSIVRGRECGSTIATDAKPREPEFQNDGWMTCIDVDQSKMISASIESQFFEGVSYEEGKRRLDAFRLRKLERSEP